MTRLRRWANVVPLRPALDNLASGRPLPPRAAALTFDDGYLDNATLAGPVLAAAGLPATFFLVPGFLDGAEPVWWEELGWAFAHTSATTLAWDGRRYDVSPHPGPGRDYGRRDSARKAADDRMRADAVTELRERTTRRAGAGAAVHGLGRGRPADRPRHGHQFVHVPPPDPGQRADRGARAGAFRLATGPRGPLPAPRGRARVPQRQAAGLHGGHPRPRAPSQLRLRRHHAEGARGAGYRSARGTASHGRRGGRRPQPPARGAPAGQQDRPLATSLG